jgi:peptidoglycan/LPS O-acetylase OafA/YrhL
LYGDSTLKSASGAHPRRVSRLDGVRAIAALAVVCFHAWLYRVDRPHGDRTELLDQVLGRASTGLICFFVLSGYLLYGAFARAALSGGPGVALVPYLRRRAARILPAYWVCCAGCLVLYTAVGYRSITPSAQELPIFALLGQNYSLSTMGRLNPVTWTLGVELAFYALLPVVGWLALRLGSGRIRAQVMLVLALIALSPAWDLLVLARGWDRVTEQALPAYLGCFGLGMLVAVWAQWRRSSERANERVGARVTAALVAAAVLVVVGDGMVHENGWWLHGFGESFLRPSVQLEALGHLGEAAGFALLIAAAACGSGPAVGWLGWRPVAALGVISYGLYLWHLPLLIAMREAGLLPESLAPRLLVVLAASVAAAAASWRWIERPWIERGQAADPGGLAATGRRSTTPTRSGQPATSAPSMGRANFE